MFLRSQYSNGAEFVKLNYEYIKIFIHKNIQRISWLIFTNKLIYLRYIYIYSYIVSA